MVKQLLTLVCALGLGAFQSNAQLVAHYNFKNHSGQDLSGNNLTATPSYETILDTSDHIGIKKEATWFTNKVGSGYVVAHNSALNFTNHLSIAVWIKPSELFGSHKILDKLNGVTTGNFELDIYDGALRFWVASDHVEQSFQTMAVNNWYHIVATYDGFTAKLYINGQMLESAPVTGNCVTNSSDMIIGYGQASNVGGAFGGAMDDLRIYSNTLSAGEVVDLYNNVDPQLLSKWTFNDGTANDEIGSDNGNVNGATLTTDRFGNSNQAYSFDGVDDEIDFNGSSFDKKDFTLSFWINTVNHNYKTILSKWASNNGGIQFEDYPSIRYGIYTSNGTMRSANPTNLTSANWHHIVLTNRFSDSSSFYIDAIYVGSSLTSFANQTITASARFFIGSTNVNSNNFNGSIDDIYIYNYVISPTDISDLYHSGGYGLSTNGLEEKTLGNTMKLYPNPTNSFINVEFLNQNNSSEIKIMNILNEVVLTQTVNDEGNKIDVSQLKSGVYFIQSNTGERLKFIKE